MSLPTASVVVTASAGEPHLQGCLRSISRLDYPRGLWQLVVVRRSPGGDGLEPAGPVATVSAPGAGVSRARNAGAAASTGDIVAFIDPDCVATSGWLRALGEAFADPGVVVAAGAVLPFPPSSLVERYAARGRSHSELRSLRAPVPWAMGPNLAVRRSALAGVGGFDERFGGGGWEDADLCWRVSCGGAGALAHAPRAIVFHRYRERLREFLRQQYRYGAGFALLQTKWPGHLGSAGLSSALALLGDGTARARATLAFGRRPLAARFAALDVLRTVAQISGYSATLVARRP